VNVYLVEWIQWDAEAPTVMPDRYFPTKSSAMFFGKSVEGLVYLLNIAPPTSRFTTCNILNGENFLRDRILLKNWRK